MAPTLKHQPYSAEFYPSDELVALHFAHSRRRSLKRHNRDVLTNAQKIGHPPLPSILFKRS